MGFPIKRSAPASVLEAVHRNRPGGGKVIAGDVPGVVVEHTKRGQYNVTFSAGDLGPLGLDTCGVAANPVLDFPENRPLKAYASHSPGSAQINADGKLAENLADAAFDLVLAC